ncbi:MAG: hypothetical protein QM658_00320 [Gordonia sp. (in: high G+C Gram-positive bacteria)]
MSAEVLAGGSPAADTEGVMRVLGRCGVEAGSSSPVAALMLLDLTCGIGVDEQRALAALRDCGLPVALVGTRVDALWDWPRLLAEARRSLDPARRLPVFAVSSRIADEVPGDDGPVPESGFPALAQWCADPGDPVPHTSSTSEDVRSGRSEKHDPPVDPQRGRAERLAGARAGFAAARADLATLIRTGARELAAAADGACGSVRGRGRDGYVDWVNRQGSAYVERVTACAAEHVHHVQAAALLGLGRAGAEQRTGDEPPWTPVPPPAAKVGAEEAVLSVLGVSAGLGVGRMAVAPLADWAGLGAGGTLLATLTGLVVALALVGVRRQTARRTALRRWAGDVVAARRAAVENAVAARLGAAEAQLSREIWNRTALRCVQPSRGRSPDPAAGTSEGSTDARMA